MRPNEGPAARRTRFVHLGDRLLAIARIRAGTASVEAIAEEHEVEPKEVRHWLELHAEERVVLFDEFRDNASPESRGLMKRARHLAQLVAEADRLLRDLHQEYVLMLASRRSGYTK